MGWVDVAQLELMRVQIGGDDDVPIFDCCPHEWVYCVVADACPPRNAPKLSAKAVVLTPHVSGATDAAAAVPAASDSAATDGAAAGSSSGAGAASVVENPLAALRASNAPRPPNARRGSTVVMENPLAALRAPRGRRSSAASRGWAKLRGATRTFAHTVVQPPALAKGDYLVASKEVVVTGATRWTTTGGAPRSTVFVLAREVLRPSADAGAAPATVWRSSTSYGSEEWWYATSDPVRLSFFFVPFRFLFFSFVAHHSFPFLSCFSPSRALRPLFCRSCPSPTRARDRRRWRQRRWKQQRRRRSRRWKHPPPRPPERRGRGGCERARGRERACRRRRPASSLLRSLR